MRHETRVVCTQCWNLIILIQQSPCIAAEDTIAQRQVSTSVMFCDFLPVAAGCRWRDSPAAFEQKHGGDAARYALRAHECM